MGETVNGRGGGIFLSNFVQKLENIVKLLKHFQI